MKFTAELESDNQINFLDITIRKTPTKWIIYICDNTTERRKKATLYI